MNIQHTDGDVGTFSFQPPQELSDLIGSKLDPEKAKRMIRGFLAVYLLSKTIRGELAEKADEIVRVGVQSMSLALNQLSDISEGKESYPVVRAIDLV